MNLAPNTLTAGQRAQFESELLSRQQTLRRQIAEHLHGQTRAERAHDVAQQDNDDAPQRAPEREVAMALTDRERLELQAVTDALGRLQRNTYGVCADCASSIPFDRLKAEPWALRCVACETRREQQQRP